MSCLRYPGGKTRAVKHLLKFIPDREVYVSPFLGGGSLELELTKRGVVYGYDIFKPLIGYWKCLITNPAQLAEEIELLMPINSELFADYRNNLLENLVSQDYDTGNYKLAARYFALNRSSLSGTTL